MNPSEFYDDDPARRASEEIRLGDDWKGVDEDSTYSLFWIRDTGELCAVSVQNRDVKLPGSLGPWGTGASALTDVNDDDLSIEVLGAIEAEAEARRLIVEADNDIEPLRRLLN